MKTTLLLGTAAFDNATLGMIESSPLIQALAWLAVAACFAIAIGLAVSHLRGRSTPRRFAALGSVGAIFGLVAIGLAMQARPSLAADPEFTWRDKVNDGIGKLGTSSNQIVDLPISALTAVTNGQPVTLTHSFMRLNSTGAAAAGTNTITLADSGVAGRWVVIVNEGTSNKLAIARTGNWTSVAVEVETNGVLTVVAPTTNTWHGN